MKKMSKNTVKYPSRKKYLAPVKEGEVKEEVISEEEHKKRLEKLRALGLIK